MILGLITLRNGWQFNQVTSGLIVDETYVDIKLLLVCFSYSGGLLVSHYFLILLESRLYLDLMT